MQKKWELKPNAPEDFVTKFPEIPKTILQLLFNRNLLTQKEIDDFFSSDYESGIHDPFLFSQMHIAVERIFTAIDKKEKITIFGDYDADGVTGTTIGSIAFQALGLKEGVDYDIYLPDRFTEGYGLKTASVHTLAKLGTKVIITVDCGITSLQEVDVAKELGMDVIITDHHSIPEVLPRAVAVMNPRLPQETYPCKFLCGAGTLYKFMQALLRESEKRNRVPENFNREAIEKWLLDLVAIGTVADLVPLLDENRVLTKYGLIVLAKTKKIGLQKLLEHSGLKTGRELTTYNIGFQIGPRINASGRIHHSSVSYELLMTQDAKRAEELALQIEETNTQRKKLTDNIVQSADAQIQTFPPNQKLLVTFGDGWPTGVVGVAASRLMQRYSKPVIVASKFEGKIIASGRSIPTFDMIATLRELDPSWYENCGGHPMACGFTIAQGKNFDEFRNALLQLAQSKITDDDVVPRLEIETEISLHDVTWELFEYLEKMQPFGKENAKPVFLIKNCHVVDASAIGSDSTHLRLKVVSENKEKKFSCIGFGLAKHLKDISHGGIIDIVAEIDVNEWNGNRELQLRIIDLH